ncbi:MAG: hypothetical protein M1817_003403 [Caeruleum heppii]|nr:MAG: hypothetical protein M1817_003403 [Caeruleum heppii]
MTLDQVDPRLRVYPQHPPLPKESGSGSASASGPASGSTFPPPAPQAENAIRLPPPSRTHITESISPLPYYHNPTGAPPSISAAAPLLAPYDPNNDPKRPRACEACRGLKVRCEPDTTDAGKPCLRCAKAGRSCVVTAPSRKRQKRTDNKVAELEKKIDALTARLEATKSTEPESDDYSGDDEERASRPSLDDPRAYDSPAQRTCPADVKLMSWRRQSEEQSGTPINDRSTTGSSTPRSHLKRTYSAEGDGASYPAIRPPPALRPNVRDAIAPASNDEPRSVHGHPTTTIDAARVTPTCPAEATAGYPTGTLPKYDYADVVDRGVVPPELAATIFERYVKDFTCHVPAVVFPPDTVANDLRKAKPILFLAILCAASGVSHPDLQRTLTGELMDLLAKRIICKGEKSLELIQTLHVATLWYWPPKFYEELKFYQFIHIGAVMAIDIGMGKRRPPAAKASSTASRRDQHPWRRVILQHPDTAEVRRAWLTCYFMCATVSQSLRRTNLIQWTPYMDDCIEFLETSPEALPSDKLLCQWVRVQHIADEVGRQFSMDDPCANLGLSDLKVQYALKGFERQLDDWSSHMPEGIENAALRLNGHVVNLYIHEICLHHEHNVDDFRPPFTEDALKAQASAQSELLTPSHIAALTTCLSATHDVFEIFLGYELEAVRTLPIFHFVRVAYAVVLLIKMFFAATSSGGELGKVISTEDMKTELYLDRLLEQFRAAAEGEKCRPASKFLMVLVLLKTWFQKQRAGAISEAQTTKTCGHSGGMQFLGGEQGLEGVMKRSWAGPPGDGHMSIRSSTSSPAPGTVAYPSNANGAIGPVGSLNGNGQIDQALKPAYDSASTPLQLLSEVAMGNSTNLSDGTGNPASSGWYHNYNAPDNGTATAPTSRQMTANVPPVDTENPQDPGGSWMSGNGAVEEAFGDGFGQAVGMTLGDGEFSSIFMNDLFASMMGDGTTNFLEMM